MQELRPMASTRIRLALENDLAARAPPLRFAIDFRCATQRQKRIKALGLMLHGVDP